MVEIPAERRMLERLLVQALLEADGGNPAAASDYATAVLLLLDPERDPELGEVAADVLRRVGIHERRPITFE